jgi:[ribosomal protein S5]-alanine N-acetyltransferase
MPEEHGHPGMYDCRSRRVTPTVRSWRASGWCSRVSAAVDLRVSRVAPAGDIRLMARRTRPAREQLDWNPPALGPIFVAGARVVLREWTRADGEAVRIYAEDPEVVRYLIRAPTELLAEPALAIDEAQESRRTEYAFAVIDRDSDGVIGSAEVYVDSVRHHPGEIGYILRRDVWGQGLATEVAELLLRFGFDDLGLHRLWASCDPANAASIRVLEKVGMQYEGLLRHQYLAHDGTWRDAVIYAVVAS